MGGSTVLLFPVTNGKVIHFVVKSSQVNFIQLTQMLIFTEMIIIFFITGSHTLV